MKINVSEIGENGVEIVVAKYKDWLGNINGFDSQRSLTKFNSKFHFKLDIQKIVNEITILGNINFSIITSCSLCLEGVNEKIDVPIKLVLSPLKEATDENIDDNFDTFDGDIIDLNNYLKEQIMLSLPYKVLCRSNCKGLCTECGINLNVSNCECKDKWVDPRFAILKNIKV